MTPEELLAKLDFAKGNGLIPVITQDAKTKAVLMQAFANKEAVELTLKTKKATYWSRSRNEIWVKGETAATPKKSSPYPQTATTTHYSTSSSKQDPHATPANTAASITNFSNSFLF